MERFWNRPAEWNVLRAIYDTDAVRDPARGAEAFDQAGASDAARLAVCIHPDMLVVDLGCGIGRVMKPLAPLCREIIGFDISEAMIQGSREYLAGIANARVEKTAGSSLPTIEDASVGFLYSVLCFIHVDKRSAFRYFREIQRVLQSSSGPVNWELARQVGIATAAMGAEDREPSDEDRRSFEEVVRVAELQVADFTGLDGPSDLPDVQAVRRARWVQANIEGLRGVLEPAAERMGAAITSAQREAIPEEAQTQAGVAQLIGQLSPLLLGAQVGSVLGTLAQQVLGQYDIAVPRPEGSGTLMFVVPNVAAFERDWSLDATDFRTWIAIHEVTHRFEFARPWALPRFRELVDEICRIVEGVVNLEVVATDAAGMIGEGRDLAKIAPNVVVKLPTTRDGLKACRALVGEGIGTNLTLCFSPAQALLVAKAGARYVSPFLGRLDDIAHVGMDLVRTIRTIYDNYDFPTQILAASLRNRGIG